MHASHSPAPGGPITTPQELARRLEPILTPAAAIVCVGSDLNGDDAAGPLVARRLQGAIPWKLYDTQTAPESFLMKIARGNPDSVLLIDALHFGGDAGALHLFEADDISGQGPSTHGPAPMAFLEALQMIHPCSCAVLGIQPQRVDVGSPPTDSLLAAVELIVQAFAILAQAADDPPA